MNDIKKTIIVIFSENYDDFTNDNSLHEINSIKLIEILVKIEERFDIEFNDVEYISNFKTIDDIYERVLCLLKKEI